MVKVVDIYGGKDPREVPRYSVIEAAAYLGMPPSTLRPWVRGRGLPPLVRIPRRSRSQVVLLSFNNLVECFVLRAIRRDHKISLQKVRRSLRYVQGELSVQRPLLSRDFETDGISLFITHFGQLLNVSRAGQTAMRTMLSASLKRIDRDPHGLATAFSPWRNHVTEPETVIVDPRIAFGRLTVKGTGIRVSVLSDRFLAGESIRGLAEDYDVAVELVESAVRWGPSVQAAA